MLFRFDGEDAIAIAQPAHAWVSGQLARAWGNDHYERFEPWEEVCLAAEQHDIGWLPWEANPTLNPETGRPFSFRELPKDQHIDLWSQAGTLALAYGRYPALFVSLHGTGLYERFGPGPDPSPQTLEMIEKLLERERAFQQRQIERLSTSPRYADYVKPEVIERNRQLISTWDAMSLVLCGGFEGSASIGKEFTFAIQDSGQRTPDEISERIHVEPWPFSGDEVRLIADGRRLTGRSSDDAELRDALRNAPWVTLAITLIPA
jgi:hypothetical protein